MTLKMCAFWIFVFVLSSANAQAGLSCMNFISSSNLTEVALSPRLESLLKTRFDEEFQAPVVKFLGDVALSKAHPEAARFELPQGSVSVFVFDSLVFDNSPLLESFLTELDSKLRSPGLIVIESLPVYLKEDFLSVLTNFHNKSANHFSPYFKNQEGGTLEVVIDVFNYSDLVMDEAPVADRRAEDETIDFSLVADEEFMPALQTFETAVPSPTVRDFKEAHPSKVITWGQMRRAASSDVSLIEFLVKFVSQELLAGQKLVVEGLAKSNSERLAEALRLRASETSSGEDSGLSPISVEEISPTAAGRLSSLEVLKFSEFLN